LAVRDCDAKPLPFAIFDDCKHALRGTPTRGSLQLVTIDTDDQKVVEVVEAHSEPVSALAKSRDGGVILAGFRDGTLSIWSVYGLKNTTKNSASDGNRRTATPRGDVGTVESGLEVETVQSRFMKTLIKDFNEDLSRAASADTRVQRLLSRAGSKDAKVLTSADSLQSSPLVAPNSALKASLQRDESKADGLLPLQRKLQGPIVPVLRGHQCRSRILSCALDVDMDICVSCSYATGMVFHSIKDGRLLRIVPGLHGGHLVVMRTGYVVVWSAETRQLVSCSLNGEIVSKTEIDPAFGEVVDMMTTSDGLHLLVGTNGVPSSEGGGGDGGGGCVHVFYGCQLQHVHDIVVGPGDGVASFLLDTLEVTLIVYTRRQALLVFNDPVVSAKMIASTLSLGWHGVL